MRLTQIPENRPSPTSKRRNGEWGHPRSEDKPFIALDGEGFNNPDGSQDYALMCSSKLGLLSTPDLSRLSTKSILDWVWNGHNSAEEILVIYGGNYDFNMWLRDISRKKALEIHKGASKRKGITVFGYRILWLQGKFMRITKHGRSVTVYDTLPFFQGKFLDAVEGLIGHLLKAEDRELIARMKAARDVFDRADIATVSEYVTKECEYLSLLITELRDKCVEADLLPSSWFGPGSIATKVWKKYGIKNHMALPPEPVRIASETAYAGGRFENFKYGISYDCAWEYDLQSAYPAAFRLVPSLAQGQWVHHPGLSGTEPVFSPFTLYHVRYESDNRVLPNPLFYRDKKGGIFYPPTVEGWYWGPEYEAMLSHWMPNVDYAGTLEVLEAWEFVENPGNERPFGFVNDIYAMRQEQKAHKRARNGLYNAGLDKVLKLALNSLYGKTVQQVGWQIVDGELKRPGTYQLEWGGFTTSWCRAQMIKAISQDPEAVIAIETDGIFTTRPLRLDVSENLGAWEEEEFRSLAYIKSGMYFPEWGTVAAKTRMRGVPGRGLPYWKLEQLLSDPWGEPVVQMEQKEFKVIGSALNEGDAGWEAWCSWRTFQQSVALYPQNKRRHDHFACDEAGLRAGWHNTFVPSYGGVSSRNVREWDK